MGAQKQTQDRQETNPVRSMKKILLLSPVTKEIVQTKLKQEEPSGQERCESGGALEGFVVAFGGLSTGQQLFPGENIQILGCIFWVACT